MMGQAFQWMITHGYVAIFGLFVPGIVGIPYSMKCCWGSGLLPVW